MKWDEEEKLLHLLHLPQDSQHDTLKSNYILIICLKTQTFK
jgi:hypothetical protein